MARKQTLKSLLGANDSRVDVDLNLDEQTFRAPTVRAGNYQVSAPVYAKTNALSQLSDSLERYSGPILKGYANIKEQQSLAMADASELLTTEQLKLLDAGDSSGLTESINNDKRKIDEAQRKKLITFAENPNNYERAYRRVGSRVAGVFVEDYLNNMDKYAEDESFDLYTKAEEIAEQYGLNGLGKEEFSKQINSISESTKARFGELKNAHMIREHKAETITDLSQKFSNSTWSEEAWTDATNAGTVEQNQSILEGLVTNLREKNPAKADRIIELYEEGGIKIGNGAVNEEFLDKLQNARANEDKRLDLIAQGVETKRNDSVAEFQAGYSNAFSTGQTPPASTDLFIHDGLTITVDTPNVKNPADVAEAVIKSIGEIPEDDKTVSIGTRNMIINKFAGEVRKQADATRDFRRAAGADAAASKMLEIFGTKDSEGNPVYEGMVDSDAITDKVIEKTDELNETLDAIQQNPELDSAQKYTQAQRANMKFMVEVSKEHEQFTKEKEESIKALRFEEATGGDREGVVQGILDNFYASASANSDPVVALQEGQTYLKQAREFDAETDRLMLEIRNREMTDEEIASGMTSEQLSQKKIKEGNDLNADREALLQADLATDDKLDGRTKDSQQPETATSTQDDLNKNLEKANVVINEKGITGFADKKEGGIRNRQQDPVWTKGIKTKNLIQDITTPRGEGNILNQGIQDSYNMSMMVARINDPDVTNMHEAHQHNAIAYQSGEKMGLTPFQMMRDKDEVGTKMVADFIQGETIIRAARDGETGISINELENGDLKGVKFNATTLHQSTTPILPFALLNKAFLDSDNFTPQEEQQVRDYADALYDMSEQDEAGKEEIIQKMIESQVNAYAQIGFRFAK